MGTQHLQRGRWGEDLAVRHLERLGLKVIDRNWRCRDGEIDIVAGDEPNDTIIICEVKTRSSEDYGSPLAAVTPRKLRRLRGLASEWMRTHDHRAREVRIDVIGILLSRTGAPSLEHLRGVA
ncbi:MAG: YraN family protein [Actinobacteria bacterium]|jgi:putative endonuclease|nr:YraN family protein [Actinomycetota bacterium]